MAVLARRAACVGVAIALAGCYQPELLDCTVTCEGAAECATGQVCGADGYCASPDVAGHCAAPAGADASLDARVAAPDAPAAADAAPPRGTLQIAIANRGRVRVSPSGAICDSPNDHGASCMFTVDIGASITLTASIDHPGDSFTGWTTPNCAGQGSSCATICAATTTIVRAVFMQH